jgi:hypothetical protein
MTAVNLPIATRFDKRQPRLLITAVDIAEGAEDVIIILDELDNNHEIILKAIFESPKKESVITCR